jgi:hypothetical protein
MLQRMSFAVKVMLKGKRGSSNLITSICQVGETETTKLSSLELNGSTLL